MSSRRTEQASDRYRGLETWPDSTILGVMVEGQARAIAAVQSVLPAVAMAAADIVERYEAGGRIIYVGAGSSGIIARLDALELPGTYGIPAERIATLIAGGEASLQALDGSAEDDREAAVSAMRHLDIRAQDAVVGVSASGSTPFVLAAIAAAREASALIIGIACNPDAALFDLSDRHILLETVPEVVAGSTRMNAGTAQKCTLNLLSSLIAIRLGHVYDGMMVNLRADNEKLLARATAIVARISGLDSDAATGLLKRSSGAVKPAILLSAGVSSPEDARALLSRVGGNLRRALELHAEQTMQNKSA